MNENDSKLSGTESDLRSLKSQEAISVISLDTASISSEFERVELESVGETTTPVRDDKPPPIRQTVPRSWPILRDLGSRFENSRIRKDLNWRVQFWRCKICLEESYWRMRHISRQYGVWDQIVFLFLLVLVINSYWLICQNQETRAMISNLESQIISTQKQSTEKITRFQPNSPLQKFNAANLAAGATIDTSKSSSSSLNPSFGFDQSSLVLVDRPEPSANKAWCSHEKEPVLTVNLAEYVKPTAVSYQHSEWNGTVPDDAPKTYDVMACLDYYCEKSEPLVSNCTYTPNGSAEQSCNVSSPFSTKKIQFRFHGNQGNSSRTCVSLVRVYSKESPEPGERSLEDVEICSDLKHDYHNRSLLYNYFDFKSCSVLYSKRCCHECPECCEECDVKDFNKAVLFRILVYILLAPLWLVLILFTLLLSADNAT